MAGARSRRFSTDSSQENVISFSSLVIETSRLAARQFWVKTKAHYFALKFDFGWFGFHCSTVNCLVDQRQFISFLSQCEHATCECICAVVVSIFGPIIGSDVLWFLLFQILPFAFYDTRSFAYAQYYQQTVGCTTLHNCNNMISISIIFFPLFSNFASTQMHGMDMPHLPTDGTMYTSWL